MKQYAYTFVLLFIVAACAQLGLEAPKKPETPQQVINEAKETVLAVKKMINQNLTDKSYTPAVAEKRLNEVEKVEKDVKDAEALLRLGKGVEATNKASAARAAIRSLRSQVEKK
jgi:hypothetical protein